MLVWVFFNRCDLKLELREKDNSKVSASYKQSFWKAKSFLPCSVLLFIFLKLYFSRKITLFHSAGRLHYSMFQVSWTYRTKNQDENFNRNPESWLTQKKPKHPTKLHHFMGFLQSLWHMAVMVEQTQTWYKLWWWRLKITTFLLGSMKQFPLQIRTFWMAREWWHAVESQDLSMKCSQHNFV